MISLALVTFQSSAPGDCLLTGLCGLVPVDRPIASGVMFVAAGLIVGGVWGLRRLRRDS